MLITSAWAISLFVGRLPSPSFTWDWDNKFRNFSRSKKVSMEKREGAALWERYFRRKGWLQGKEKEHLYEAMQVAPEHWCLVLKTQQPPLRGISSPSSAVKNPFSLAEYEFYSVIRAALRTWVGKRSKNLSIVWDESPGWVWKTSSDLRKMWQNLSFQ